MIANGAYEGTADLTERAITVFVANSLDEEPISTYETTMDLTALFEWKEFVLPEPIELTAETESLYFGYTIEQAEGLYPFVVDGDRSNAALGDYLGSEKNGVMSWNRYGSQVGLNCIRLKVEGESFGVMNKVGIADCALPAHVMPGEEFNVGVTFQNLAYNDVTSLTVSCTVNNGDAQIKVVELSEPLHYNSISSEPVNFTFTAPTEECASVPVKIEVTGINADGAANGAGYVQRVRTASFHCFSEGFDKNVVAEIGTGTWCGYCPRGIHGVEKMEEYDTAGRFIPIAVHANDEMTATSYSNFSNLANSYPSVVFQRDTKTYGVLDPSFDIMKAVYDREIAIPALVKPQVEGFTYDASTKKITIDASVQFAIDITDGNYGFAYVILEDKVGPYNQTNYYAGQSGSLEWWDEQPSEVSMEYNSVARYIYSFSGVKESIPATVEAGQTYTHSQAVPTNTVSRIENCRIVLMVINRATSIIENAVMVPYELSGIESVEAELNGEAPVYFDLQGRSVASPREGQIYIERRGSESRKVVF